MTIWIIFALLTGAALFSVLWPLSRTPAPQDRRDLDIAFYQAQTAEIERDEARGLLGETEASSAKTEAARRLMAAAQRDGAPRPSKPMSGKPMPRNAGLWSVRIVSIASILFVPALALMLYGQIGQPALPDEPLDARLKAKPATMDMATAVAQIERHLAEVPGDGRGYEVVAPVYIQMGRPDDAARAYSKAIELLGPSGELYAGLGEAQVYLASGIVTAEAKQSFEKATGLDPESPRGLFYLGLAAEQDGDKAKALALWQTLEADSPPRAPWLAAVRGRIASLTGQDEPAPHQAQASIAPGPRANPQMAAAIQAMPDDQRQATIHRMVDGLAERLKGNGNDLEGWLRLVRAYRVLNEPSKAKDALAGARRNFAADANANKQLDALAQELGLEG